MWYNNFRFTFAHWLRWEEEKLLRSIRSLLFAFASMKWCPDQRSNEQQQLLKRNWWLLSMMHIWWCAVTKRVFIIVAKLNQFFFFSLLFFHSIRTIKLTLNCVDAIPMQNKILVFNKNCNSSMSNDHRGTVSESKPYREPLLANSIDSRNGIQRWIFHEL